MRIRRSTVSRLRATLRSEERGVALPMVLVVFLVGFALVGAFFVAIVGSAQVSNTTRSGVQAQAAAEAGIAAARLAEDPCSGTGPQSTVDVIFETTVVCDLSATQPTATITSVGHASDGTTAKVQGVVALIVHSTGGAGSAPLYTEQNMSLTNNADIQAVSSEHPADLYVANGNFTCGGSAKITGSVFIQAGSATISGACVVQGDIKANGNVTVSEGGKVNGAVESQGNVLLDGWSGVHAQSVRAKGSVTLGGSAQSIVVNAGTALTMSGNTRVETATYGTTVSLSGSAGIGSRSKASVTVPLPPSPPPFPELSKAQILASHPSPAWAHVAWTGNCTVEGTHPMKTLIQSATKPTVIDATSCAEVAFGSNSTLKVPQDVTIISRGFNLGTYSLESANTTVHTVRFMVPYEQSCASGAGRITANNFKFNSAKPLLALAYSSCGVRLDNGSTAYWPGTVVTKNFTGIPLLKYSQVPLDPSNAGGSGGGGGGGSTTATFGDTLSLRNIG